MRIEGTDFVDTDLRPSMGQPQRPTGPAFPAASAAGRAPTREELDGQLTATQQELSRLREAQEQLERAKAAVEEMRRRRAEFHAGREEMLQSLLRGVGLLEQAEHNLRRDAQQMARSLEGLKSSLSNVQGLNEQTWTDTTWETELARSLATIENARMEYTQARLAWPMLDGKGTALPVDSSATHSLSPLSGLSLGQLARLGLAFNWPVVLLGLGVIALAVVLALKR
jgi:hypothetical protein